MNIFYLHNIPKICAQMHCDKHVVKMILETCQLLCSAHYMSNSTYVPCYKLTHKNHPCSIWTRESVSNYKWLCNLGLELCKEYTYRYGKIHKCQNYIIDLQKNIPLLPKIPFSQPRQAMPDIWKHFDSIQAYRYYYFFEKYHIHSWKGKINSREIPMWIKDMYVEFENRKIT